MSPDAQRTRLTPSWDKSCAQGGCHTVGSTAPMHAEHRREPRACRRSDLLRRRLPPGFAGPTAWPRRTATPPRCSADRPARAARSATGTASRRAASVRAATPTRSTVPTAPPRPTPSRRAPTPSPPVMPAAPTPAPAATAPSHAYSASPPTTRTPVVPPAPATPRLQGGLHGQRRLPELPRRELRRRSRPCRSRRRSTTTRPPTPPPASSATVSAGGTASATCVTCHDPNPAAGPKGLAAQHTNITPVAGSPYGTTVACVECHSDIRAGGNAEVLANWTSDACADCHSVTSSAPQHATTAPVVTATSAEWLRRERHQLPHHLRRPRPAQGRGRRLYARRLPRRDQAGAKPTLKTCGSGGACHTDLHRHDTSPRRRRGQARADQHRPGICDLRRHRV